MKMCHEKVYSLTFIILVTIHVEMITVQLELVKSFPIKDIYVA